MGWLYLIPTVRGYEYFGWSQASGNLQYQGVRRSETFLCHLTETYIKLHSWKLEVRSSDTTTCFAHTSCKKKTVTRFVINVEHMITRTIYSYMTDWNLHLNEIWSTWDVPPTHAIMYQQIKCCIHWLQGGQRIYEIARINNFAWEIVPITHKTHFYVAINCINVQDWTTREFILTNALLYEGYVNWIEQFEPKEITEVLFITEYTIKVLRTVICEFLFSYSPYVLYFVYNATTKTNTTDLLHRNAPFSLS